MTMFLIELFFSSLKMNDACALIGRGDTNVLSTSEHDQLKQL